MTRYPSVLSESATLAAVCAGRSLARFGDGEFKLCAGADIKSQVRHPELAARLRGILQDSGDCLVGIPNIHSATPKAPFWRKYATYARLMSERTYGSAFISRPDSAPWIHTSEYWARLESLWVGQDVTLVRGSKKGLTPEDLIGSRSVREILCPRQHAFAQYADILVRIGTPARALLCLGPTATVLAVDLCARGVHAVDLGHVALFLRKFRRGTEMALTVEDKTCL